MKCVFLAMGITVSVTTAIIGSEQQYPLPPVVLPIMDFQSETVFNGELLADLPLPEAYDIEKKQYIAAQKLRFEFMLVSNKELKQLKSFFEKLPGQLMFKESLNSLSASL